MLSKIGGQNAVRFNYQYGINTNGDSCQDFLSLLVHKQSEQKLLFLITEKRKSALMVRVISTIGPYMLVAKAVMLIVGKLNPPYLGE